MRRVLLIGATVLAGMIGACAWLLGTAPGGAWVLARTLGPSLSFETLTGALLGDPTLTGLSYQGPGLHLSARRLALRWQPLALLRGRLHVRALEGEGLVYEALAGGPSRDPGPAPALPVELQLDQLRVLEARIILPGGEWTLDRLQGAVSAVAGQLHVSGLSVAALGAELHGEATLGLEAGYPYSARLRWHADLPDLGVLSASARIEGDAAGLTLDHQLERPFTLSTRGRLSFGGGGLSLALEGDWQDARWPLGGRPTLRSPAGGYRIEGPVDGLRLQARAGLEVPASPPLDVELTGRIGAQALEDLTLVAHLGEARAEARGRIAWAPQPHWSMVLTGHSIDPSAWAAQWPGRLDLRASVEGSLGSKGLRSDIGLTDLSGVLLDHPLAAQGQARLDHGGLSLERLVLTSQPSRLSLTGRVDWGAHTAWKLDLQASDLDPSLRWPDWPGRLSLGVRVAGGLSPEGPWSELALDHLTGRLNGQPVSGRGRGVYRAGRLDLDELALESGPNRLKARGRVADRLDLALDLSAPDLAAAWPKLGGALEVRAAVKGTPQMPAVEGRISGKALRYEDGQLEILSAQTLWGPERVEVSLDGQGLTAGGLGARTLSLRLKGRPQAFETRLAVEGPATAHPGPAEAPAEGVARSVQARLNGGWSAGRWQGRLDALDLDDPALGRWRLDAPAALVLGVGQIDLQQACLSATEGKICTAGTWAPTGGHLSADAQVLALTLLKPWLAPGMAVEGRVGGRARLELRPEGLSGSAQLDLTPGRLNLPLDDGQVLVLPFGPGAARLDARRGAVGLEADLALMDGDRLAARVSLGRPDESGTRALSGRIEAAVADPSPAEMLAPELSELRGRLSARLDLAGTLERPVISGEARIADGSARARTLGITIEEFQLSAASRGSQRLDIKAGARSGAGRLEVEGALVLDPGRGWPLDLRIRGADFQAVRLPEAVATASPDLRLRSRDGALQIEGSLLVPEAQIEIRRPPRSAVPVSADEVLVGAPSASAPTPRPLPLEATIELRLGERVRFEGFGLTGALEGKLALSATEGRTLAQGAISVKNGRYKAYGQDLKIERGRLLFAGSPTGPSLDVRATRRSQDERVTAILSLSGPLREPLAQVSSDPALPQEEAMAYLLTGRSLRQGGGSGSSVLLSQALLSGGLGRSQTLLEGVAQGVGLDQLQVQQGASLEQSALMLGKYLSPELYISYALGLFDPQGALTLRYRLSERFRLEAQSGQHQGIDLIYGVERD